jgi:hypothetical protein
MLELRVEQRLDTGTQGRGRHDHRVAAGDQHVADLGMRRRGSEADRRRRGLANFSFSMPTNWAQRKQ